MSWTLIEHQALTSSVASVTLGSGGTIPQTYKTLKVVISARSDISTDNGAYVRFNGDTGNNYSYRLAYGNGSSATSTNAASQAAGLFGYADYSTDTANTFASSEATVPNYTGSTQKPWSTDAVNETNGTTAYQAIVAGIWTGTAAITSILLKPSGTANFVSGSTFTLYGLA